MSQQYGLGRGLASLIPPKKIESDKQAVAASIPPAVSSSANDAIVSADGVLKKPSTPPFASIQSSAPRIRPTGSGSFPSPAFEPVSQIKRAQGQPVVEEKIEPQRKVQVQDRQPQSVPQVQGQSEPQKTTESLDVVKPASFPPQTLPVQAVVPKKLDGTPSPQPASLPSSVRLEAAEKSVASQEVIEVPVGKIVPNPHQPRLYFNEEKLDELARSIKEHGILQPLTVTKNGDMYELIAGERRFQAAKRAGLQTVPVIARQAEEQQKFELAITENVQRHDLNPIEEAKAYKRLMDEFHLNQEEVARKMGKSRSAVANSVRLLNLPVEIQRTVAEGKISEGHAKALLAIENSEKQRVLFEMIMASGLTVREAEAKAREVSERPPKKAKAIDPVLKERSERLTEVFGTKVKISRSGQGGKIVIEYYGDEDLEHIFQKLSGRPAVDM